MILKHLTLPFLNLRCSSLMFCLYLLTPISFCCSNSKLFADFLNLLPKGLFAVFLMILGEDFITAFPIGSNVLNKVLKTPPISLPLCKIYLYDMEFLYSFYGPIFCTFMIQVQINTILTYQETVANCL